MLRRMHRRFFLLKKLQVWPRLQSEFVDVLLKVRHTCAAAKFARLATRCPAVAPSKRGLSLPCLRCRRSAA